MGILLKMQCVALFCLVLVLLSISTCQGKTPSLEPPPQGNCLFLQSRAHGGKYVYKCNNRTWVPVSAFAKLVNISDSNISFGYYSFKYAPTNPMFAGTWYLRNSDEYLIEGGGRFGIVAGNETASVSGSDSASITQITAKATFRTDSEFTYAVSYIQRVNTKGGLPPINENKYCSSQNLRVTVSFEAEFCFYAMTDNC